MDPMSEREAEEQARAVIRRREATTPVGSTSISRQEFWGLLQIVAERPSLQHCANKLHTLGANDEENRRLVSFFDALLSMFGDAYDDREAYRPAVAAELTMIGHMLLLGDTRERDEGWKQFDKWQEARKVEKLQQEIRWVRWQEEHPEAMDRAS